MSSELERFNQYRKLRLSRVESPLSQRFQSPPAVYFPLSPRHWKRSDSKAFSRSSSPPNRSGEGNRSQICFLKPPIGWAFTRPTAWSLKIVSPVLKQQQQRAWTT